MYFHWVRDSSLPWLCSKTSLLPPLAAGAAGEVLAGLEQSWDAALPSQNLLSNCSVSGCTLSSSAYILPFGVPQSLKMCASHLQTARKGEKCLKCVCGVSEPSSHIYFLFRRWLQIVSLKDNVFHQTFFQFKVYEKSKLLQEPHWDRFSCVLKYLLLLAVKFLLLGS